jgi:hypothetical protein
MEWAERLEIGPCAFKREIGTDYFHNIVRGGDLLMVCDGIATDRWQTYPRQRN